MINRQEALSLVNKYLKNKENKLISLYVEAILRKLANLLDEDEDLWGLTGLLFNIDYEYTEDDKENRGTISSQILQDLLPGEGINAIKSNNYLYTDVLPVSSLDKALISAEAAVKLILMVAKTVPSKNLNDIDVDLLLKKIDDNSSASDKTISRLKLCKDNNIDLENFLKLSLSIMRTIPLNAEL